MQWVQQVGEAVGDAGSGREWLSEKGTVDPANVFFTDVAALRCQLSELLPRTD